MARPKEFDVSEALDRAKRLFWLNGFEATSLRDLTAASRVGRQSLYDTFGDKRHLYLAALRRYVEADFGRGLAILEAPNAGAPAVESYFHWMLETQAGPPPRAACFMVNATTELAPRDEAVAKVVRSAQQRLGAAFLHAVRNGLAGGEIGPPRDPPETVARLLTCAAMGISVAAKAGFTREALEDMARVALHALPEPNATPSLRVQPTTQPS